MQRVMVRLARGVARSSRVARQRRVMWRLPRGAAQLPCWAACGTAWVAFDGGRASGWVTDSVASCRLSAACGGARDRASTASRDDPAVHGSGGLPRPAVSWRHAALPALGCVLGAVGEHGPARSNSIIARAFHATKRHCIRKVSQFLFSTASQCVHRRRCAGAFSSFPEFCCGAGRGFGRASKSV